MKNVAIDKQVGGILLNLAIQACVDYSRHLVNKVALCSRAASDSSWSEARAESEVSKEIASALKS
jgi:hypothetical protein